MPATEGADATASLPWRATGPEKRRTEPSGPITVKSYRPSVSDVSQVYVFDAPGATVNGCP
ncbi:hypothetical protein ACWCXB_02460 [Streptomyces sp. NPDC001514]